MEIIFPLRFTLIGILPRELHAIKGTLFYQRRHARGGGAIIPPHEYYFSNVACKFGLFRGLDMQLDR